MPNTSVERFWLKVEKGAEGACWEWKCGRDKDGYGKIKFNGRHDRAHRIAWSLHSGQTIPSGMFVCHSCDNPPCCNPAHLFLGTPRDNARDASAKGRVAGQQKTHCPSGHAYTPANTRTVMRKGWTTRLCIQCDRDSCKARYHANRAARLIQQAVCAKARRAADPDEWRRKAREHTRAYRARKRDAAIHLQSPS